MGVQYLSTGLPGQSVPMQASSIEQYKSQGNPLALSPVMLPRDSFTPRKLVSAVSDPPAYSLIDTYTKHQEPKDKFFSKSPHKLTIAEAHKLSLSFLRFLKENNITPFNLHKKPMEVVQVVDNYQKLQQALGIHLTYGVSPESSFEQVLEGALSQL